MSKDGDSLGTQRPTPENCVYTKEKGVEEEVLPPCRRTMKRRRSTKRKVPECATNQAKKRLKVGEEGICRNSDFGKDLMFEMLVRLPIKCLLRFKSVSKYWYRLIGSPEFIKFRLRKACDDPNYTEHKLICLSRESSGVVFRQSLLHPALRDPDSFYRLRTHISHPMEFWEEESQSYVLKFVGSCSGLVCIVGINNRLIVWNPALRKCKRLPYFGRGSSVFYGFGYDEASDDFKVVGIRNTPKTLVKIYSARTNAWKKLEEVGFEVDRVDGHGCFLNGKVHWATRKSILTVDLSTERFGVVELPDSTRVQECDDRSIHAIGEFLAMFCYHSTAHRVKAADLWVMDESWARVSKSLDGSSTSKQIAWFAAKEGDRPFHLTRVTSVEAGEAWRSIQIPGHMTGNAITAFLLYCVKLDDYSFKHPRGVHSYLGPPLQPATAYVESLAWPFSKSFE